MNDGIGIILALRNESPTYFLNLGALSAAQGYIRPSCSAVYTELAPRRQQFHVAPAMPALRVHHFGGYSKTHYKKLVTYVESQGGGDSSVVRAPDS